MHQSTVQGHRFNYPALMGCYLAVNALSDAYLLVDGPDCALYKTHYIYGRHDLRSSLLDIGGRHRVCYTNVCAQSVTKDHNQLIYRRLKTLDGMSEPGVVMLTSLPGCSLTGIDYDLVLRNVETVLRKPALAIPPTSLAGDWIDGYGVTLRALSRRVELEPGRTGPDRAAVVGCLADRNEGDHRGNRAELERMLAALGLKLVSVWLDGGSYADLRRVEEAGLIVSLPYAREAAAELARRTGAKLVETGLPLGLGATGEWLRQVARAAGRQAEAEAFIDRELRDAVPRLEWAAPHLFLHRSAVLMGDPFQLDGLLEMAEDLGLEVRRCVVMGRAGRGPLTSAGRCPSVLFEPDIYHPEVTEIFSKPPDLLVSNLNDVVRLLQRRSHTTALVEFGFPSYDHHALADIPFLGYRGFLALAERLADRLSATRHASMHREPRGRSPQGPGDAGPRPASEAAPF